MTNESTTPNAERAWAAWDAILADPDSHHQSYWFVRGACGSTACYGGMVCHLAGDTPVWPHEDSTVASMVRTADGDQIFAAERAQALLGIDQKQADELFLGAGDRDELYHAIVTIFGERPA